MPSGGGSEERDLRALARPVDRLTPDDFVEHPLWGFDLDMESTPGLDETAVRPYQFQSLPQSTDGLFTAATLSPPNGIGVPGAVFFRLKDGKPAKARLALLVPYYPLEHDEQGRVDTGSPYWKFLERDAADLRAMFPLRYEAALTIAGHPFRLTGTVVLRP